MPAFRLVVAKDGPKLATHDDAAPKLRGGCGRLVGRRVNADAIAASQSGSATLGPSTLPSIYTAVQQQLGLKLESSKGPVQVLVIDRIKKPSDN